MHVICTNSWPSCNTPRPETRTADDENTTDDERGTFSAEESRAIALSPREIECLEWLGRGLLDERIAVRLGLSRSTIRLHLSNARRKLKAKTREQALVRAVQLRLIAP